MTKKRSERTASLPGDELIDNPMIVTTHAITVDAPPTSIWPWLVQMGWGRGGWYTARWVDRLLFPANAPSADHIVPALQHLQVGDFIADGAPETGAGFVVEVLEPDHHLVLHSTTHLPPGWAQRFGAWIDWSWAFVLERVDDRHTRIVVRSRGRVGPRWIAIAYRLAIIPADFVMSHQMLRGLKTRVEVALRDAARSASAPADIPAATERRVPDVSKVGGAVDLYWIPLGAGAHVVRWNGKLFEAFSALVQRRRRCDLYHSALVVHVPEGRFVIEQAPIPDVHGERRGVVAEGPVGTTWAGRLRLFRYEIRRWRDGSIPDVCDAVASPVRLTDDLASAQRVLDVLPSIPTPVWGRDQLGAGEMWNSNSVIAWVLSRSGMDLATVRPPPGGRAPGWDAGRFVAASAAGRARLTPG